MLNGFESALMARREALRSQEAPKELSEGNIDLLVSIARDSKHSDQARALILLIKENARRNAAGEEPIRVR